VSSAPRVDGARLRRDLTDLARFGATGSGGVSRTSYSAAYDIGIVTSVVGLGGGTAEFVGRADHAGTTPMSQRRDALRAAGRLGLTSQAMPSGAGHNSQNLARIAPTWMIFVPSVAGRSHSPVEHTGWTDIENGADVLLATLIELASS
jgi:acetylornithine deacetylase/succinyl-diaminopimelate desuccinylase-like protein